MRRIAYRLWGGEPFLRFATEASAFLIATWTFLGLYASGYESRWILYTSEVIATVLVADFIGYAVLFYLEGK